MSKLRNKHRRRQRATQAVSRCRDWIWPGKKAGLAHSLSQLSIRPLTLTLRVARRLPPSIHRSQKILQQVRRLAIEGDKSATLLWYQIHRNFLPSLKRTLRRRNQRAWQLTKRQLCAQRREHQGQKSVRKVSANLVGRMTQTMTS